MADEIKDNALVEEALADIGLNALELEAAEKEKKKVKKKKKRQHKMTQVFKSDVLELMLSELISSLKNGMDALFLIEFDKETRNYDSFNTAAKRIKAIQGTHLIFMTELDTASHCFKPYTIATLNKKHRAVRAIIEEGLQRFTNIEKGILKAKRIDNHYIIQFAKEICQFITNFHCVLHKDTPHKERQRIVEEYCE